MMRIIYTFIALLFFIFQAESQNIDLGMASNDLWSTIDINDYVYQNQIREDTWAGISSNNEFEIRLNKKLLVHMDNDTKDFITNPGNRDIYGIIVADGIEHFQVRCS